MSEQTLFFDLDGLIDTLVVDLPTGLRQIADAIEAKRISGKYVTSIAEGVGNDSVRMLVRFSITGGIFQKEPAPPLLEQEKV